MRWVLAVWWVTISGAFTAGASGGVLAAVERALPYLEEEGVWWIEDKKCVSCHHTTFLVWAKDLAVEAGLDLDDAVLDDQRQWLLQSLLSPVVDSKTGEEDPDKLKGDTNVEGVAQVLVSTTAESLSSETSDALLVIIASNQLEEGGWKSGGQLPRQVRPEKETQWVSNQWMKTALGKAYEFEAEPDTGAMEAQTAEWYAMNVVLSQDEISVDALLDRQNEDGGWSWIDGESSSSTGTGQALFALGRLGQLKRYKEALDRGRLYLIRSQSEDGHWETKSTKDRENSTRISDFWGSAWAVIGLLESWSD
tara:strand:- start:1364 stop:2287 length:924 start_codon:yes stop_codon:yes gene_type:complete